MLCDYNAKYYGEQREEASRSPVQRAVRRRAPHRFDLARDERAGADQSLRAIRPELKVLLMSATPQRYGTAAALDAGAFLQKPFTITNADAIQSLVDAS